MSSLTSQTVREACAHISSSPTLVKPDSVQASISRSQARTRGKKIWIDLENSPHVPFFKPIIEELEKHGHSVLLTARDCFQVCDLADLLELKYKRIGHHYGKHTLAKLAGLGIRVLQLSPTVLKNKPDLAISHGSRSMFVLASLLGIPTVTIFDYEHARWIKVVKPSWVMAPDVIPDEAVCAMGVEKERILRYPGIKEDVYAPSFKPDPSIKRRIGLAANDLVVTLRPPANEAHYHNPESDRLLRSTLEYLGSKPNLTVVILPRTSQQESELRKSWPQKFVEKRFIVPQQVVDGLDLIWYSDLVISGGGTMNREAAALGVPVYSIFRGKIGAVDHHLADTGRLVLLESAEDVRTKIRLVRRQRAAQPDASQQPALQTIVSEIGKLLESKC
jgi:predicted glycosyltransferase